MSRKQEHPIQAMGFWLFGFLSVVLAVLKLTVAGYWSWWRVMLPFLAFLGPQRGVFPGWLPMLLLAEAGRRRGGAYHRAEAFEGGVQHSGAVISLPVFGQPVATRRRTSLEGILAVLGEIRGGGPVWDVWWHSLCTGRGLSAASIKSTPETLTSSL